MEVACVRRPQVEKRDGVTLEVDGIQLFAFPKAAECEGRGAMHLQLGMRVRNDYFGI